MKDNIEPAKNLAPEDALEQEENRARKVYAKALEVLARREVCTAQLQEKLIKAFPDSHNLIAKACARLQQDGYLSDQRFAEAYVRSRFNKGYGANRIVRELIHKGVSEPLAKQTLVEAKEGQSTPYTAVFGAWRKKFKQPPATYEEKSKQMRFLIYRGFSMGEVQGLMESLEDLLFEQEEGY